MLNSLPQPSLSRPLERIVRHGQHEKTPAELSEKTRRKPTEGSLTLDGLLNARNLASAIASWARKPTSQFCALHGAYAAWPCHVANLATESYSFLVAAATLAPYFPFASAMRAGFQRQVRMLSDRHSSTCLTLELSGAVGVRLSE